MKGLKFIFSYIIKFKVVSIVIISLLATIYLQVQIPKMMGNSITHLTNYTIVKQTQDRKPEIIEAINLFTKSDYDEEGFNEFVEGLNDDEIESYAKIILGDLSTYEKTGLTPKELLISDTISFKDHFISSIKIFIITAALLMLTNFVASIIISWIAAKAIVLMRFDLFRKLQKLAVRYFDKHTDGDVLSIFTNDVDNISNAITQAIVQVLSAILLLIAVTYAMFKENVTLAFSVLGLGILLLIILTFIMSKAKFYVSRQQKSLGALNGYIDERVSGQHIVITNGLEDVSVDKFKEYNDEYRNISIRGQAYSGMLVPVIQGFTLLSVAVVAFVGGKLAIENIIEIGLLVTFIQYATRFFQAYMQCASQYNMIQLALAGADRVEDVLVEEEDIITENSVNDYQSLTNHLELKDLSFGYDDKEVLHNINVEIEKGKMVALVGPTGSGKTTIMNLLNRFYTIEKGDILFDGVSINDIAVDQLRSNIGIVLQDSFLFSGSIKENIAYGKANATDEEIENAAKLANIHDFIISLEDGYDTKVNNSSNILSSGQKQLVSIARTVLTDPDLLVLDEATSNVDTVTEAKIQKAMENVIRNRTSFVIAHRLKTIINADIILVLKNGEIIEQGSHKELLQQDGLYAELYHNQFVFS